MLSILLSLILQVPDKDYNLTDFRLPESGAMMLWVDVGAGLGVDSEGWDGEDTVSYYPDMQRSSGESSNDYCRLYNIWDKNSERNDLNVNILTMISSEKSNRFSYSLRDTSSVDSFSYWTDYDTVRLYDYNSSGLEYWLSINEDWFFYPFKKIFFFGLDGFSRIDYDYLHYHFNNEDEYFQEIEEETSYYDDFVFELRTGLMLGVGRLRPLEYPSRAIVMAEILEEEGICDPDPVMLSELAELFARRWEYPLKYWHPDWEFYEDAEELLVEFGVKTGDVNIRNWMRIIEASSVWNFSGDWGDYFDLGRPYGIRLIVNPLVLNFRYDLERRHSFGEYWRYGIWNYSDVLTDVRTFELDFSFKPVVVALEGGYPLSNTMHFYGEIDFSISPFHYSVTENWSRNINDTTVTVRDTTVIENVFKPENYYLYCDLRLRKYIIYDLSVTAGYAASLGRSTYVRYYDYEEVISYWNNKISIGGKYDFFNRFSFEIQGQLRINYNRGYYEYFMRNYTDWDVGSGISASVSYRFF